MKRPIVLIALVIISVTSLPYAALSQDEERVASELLRETAKETALFMKNGSVNLNVQPESTHPMMRQIFTEAFMNKGLGVVSGSEYSDYSVTLDVRGMNSSTALHQKSSYFRTVSLLFGVLVHDNRKDSVLWSKEYKLSKKDAFEGEPQYEYRDLSIVQEDSWIDSLLTPVVATAAAIIIIVLLFTVRGS
jgi:hypothetical protein